MPKRPLATERRRDNQQWILDWVTKTAGRVQNFAYDSRVLPAEVKSYRMIHRVLDRYARHFENVARAAEEAGHTETAFVHYWRAADHYRDAQHPIFYDDHPEKIYLHTKMMECYDKVRQYAPYEIQLVEIPWNGVQIQGLFHKCGKPGAPTVLHLPGMDQTKETFPDPTDNAYIHRGMNVLVIDGPGQGMSNIRKIRPTDSNYEQAASAAISWLIEQPDVDPNKVGMAGISFGSFWAMRTASIDPRVKGIATASACFSTKRSIFEEASPRFKQMFMYMADVHDEESFDAMADKMTMDGHAANIKCPSLTCIGEYDPLCHLDDAMPIWGQIQGPREMWILEDDFHSPPKIEGLGGSDVYYYLADWLRDALNGKVPNDLDKVRIIPKKSGFGPYSPAAKGVYLPDRVALPPVPDDLTVRKNG